MRCSNSPGDSSELTPCRKVFLDIDDRLGLAEPSLQALHLTLELRDPSRQRIHLLDFAASPFWLQRRQRPFLPLTAPLRQRGRIHALSTQQRSDLSRLMAAGICLREQREFVLHREPAPLRLVRHLRVGYRSGGGKAPADAAANFGEAPPLRSVSLRETELSSDSSPKFASPETILSLSLSGSFILQATFSPSLESNLLR